MCDCVRLRTGVVPEGLKQPPVVAENPFSEWASSIGLGSLQDWIRVRTGGIPADQSQPPVVAESEDCELLFPLDQLWDSLAWVDMFWLICNASPVVCLLCMAWITVRLWRNGERPQGQVSNRDRSHRKGLCGGSREAQQPWPRQLAMKTQTPAWARKPQQAPRGPLALPQGHAKPQG